MRVNRKQMGKAIIMWCVVALTAFAGVAQASYDRGEGERCGDHLKQGAKEFRRIGKKLGLTDTQKAQAKAIFQANRDLVKPLFMALRTERKNLRALIHADTIDEAAIRAETAKVAGIMADLNVNRAKVSAQFRAILTPAQLTTLRSLRQKDDGAMPVIPPSPES